MTESAIVFYDGSCGLCHRAVRWLATHDRAGALRYAPLGGETFRERFDEAARGALPDSLVYAEEDGRVLTRSDAVVAALRRLGAPRRAATLGLVPRPLRDAGYDLVARVRRRLVTRPREQCPRLPPELARRFLP